MVIQEENSLEATRFELEQMEEQHQVEREREDDSNDVQEPKKKVKEIEVLCVLCGQQGQVIANLTVWLWATEKQLSVLCAPEGPFPREIRNGGT